MGTSRLQANFDLYNLFNSNAVLTENFAYDVWRMPTQVLQARFFKLSGQFDF